MRKLQQRVGEAEPIEDVHDRRVDAVAAEVAVEVRVRLEQDDGNVLSCEQEGEHRACGSRADHAAGGVADGCDLAGRTRVGQEALQRASDAVRAFHHQQMARAVDQLEPAEPGDVLAEAARPARAEVRVVGAPQQQGGMVEPAQPVKHIEGRALVGGVHLAAQEPSCLRAPPPVGQVGRDVAAEQLVGQRGAITHGGAQRKCAAQHRWP